MERRVIGYQEKERRKPDDIRDLAVKELEVRRNAALEIIEQQQLIAAAAQDKIDAINSTGDNPTIVLEVDYLKVEYDKYTSSEHVTKTEQFAMNETSIRRTVSACADILNGNKDTRLSKVAIEVIVNQQLTLIDLQDIAEWQRRLAMHTGARHSELIDGTFGGK